MNANIDKHEKFWFEDGNLILLVDGLYFKVHRDVLQRRCGLFKDMLALPQRSDVTPEGGSIDKPVHVPDVTFIDFQAILEDAYSGGRFDTSTRSATGLRSIALVAEKLQANELVAQIACHLIEVLPPLARVSLSSQLDIKMIQKALEATRQNLDTQSTRQIERLNERERQHLSESAIPESTKATNDAAPPPNLWLVTAFKDLVLDFNVKLPFIDEAWPIAESIRWHVAIARDSIVDARRAMADRFLASRGSEYISPFTGFAINNIKLSERSHMHKLLEKAPVSKLHGWGSNYTPLINHLVPSVEAERQAIGEYCASVKLT